VDVISDVLKSRLKVAMWEEDGSSVMQAKEASGWERRSSSARACAWVG
jgi:hypothetical protein